MKREIEREIEELMDLTNWTGYVEADVLEEKNTLSEQENIVSDVIRNKVVNFLERLRPRERQRTLEEVIKRLENEVNKWNNHKSYGGQEALSFISALEFEIELLKDKLKSN